MADELIQAGIFEGMTWWNTNPAKNLFTTGVLSPPPYCSMAVGGEGLVASWAVGEHQITNNINMGVPCRSTAPNLFDEDPHMTLQVMGFDAAAWNHQHIINGGSSEEGDYPTTTTSGGGGGDLHCSSSTAVTCDGQIPVVKRLLVLDCDSGTQPLASSFNQQQQIINHIRATLLGGSPCSSLPCSPKPQSQNKVNRNEECCDSGSFALSNGAEPMFKRQRIETPSSLPTFKVRKEKLGDRITALQQLVSPFGKTDTASVLHEAIEYIKFLHDQLHGVISTPYMKNGAPIQHHHHHQQGNHNQRSKSEGEEATQDLRSRGLCLVPISSTFPVAHETPADFWTPTFGATFR